MRRQDRQIGDETVGMGRVLEHARLRKPPHMEHTSLGSGDFLPGLSFTEASLQCISSVPYQLIIIGEYCPYSLSF